MLYVFWFWEGSPVVVIVKYCIKFLNRQAPEKTLFTKFYKFVYEQCIFVLPIAQVSLERAGLQHAMEEQIFYGWWSTVTPKHNKLLSVKLFHTQESMMNYTAAEWIAKSCVGYSLGDTADYIRVLSAWRNSTSGSGNLNNWPISSRHLTSIDYN